MRRNTYTFFDGRFLWPIRPIVVRHICEDPVDAEVGPFGEYSFTLRAEGGLVLGPRLAETGFTEAVSARDRDGTDEDIPAQEAQEGLLAEEADGRGHALKNNNPGKQRFQNTDDAGKV